MICKIEFLKGPVVIDSVTAAFNDAQAARDHAVMLIGLRHLRAATGFRITDDGAIVAAWPEAQGKPAEASPRAQVA